MIRLAVAVEGETEEEFVKSVLAPHLRTRAVEVTPHLIDINDNKETHPSKRIQDLMPSYQKRVDGPFLAGSIGLTKIRAERPRFGGWITRLERLEKQQSAQ